MTTFRAPGATDAAKPALPRAPFDQPVDRP
jgi:hypothetical protein